MRSCAFRPEAPPRSSHVNVTLKTLPEKLIVPQVVGPPPTGSLHTGGDTADSVSTPAMWLPVRLFGAMSAPLRLALSTSAPVRDPSTTCAVATESSRISGDG